MTLPVEVNPLLLGANRGYQISRSVRLRSSASAFFNRTFSTPTNQKRWTLSAWVKRGTLSVTADIFNGAQSGTNDNAIRFGGGNNLVMNSYNGVGTDYGIITTAVFRDPSAWYHCVFVYDVDNATSADRAIIYVNGVRQAVTNAANGMFPLGYTAASWNTAVAHRIGSNAPSSTFADCYLTEINFIDGQALTPASFGETNVTTGVWQPKKYAGTYGTNGFYLNFSDPSAATAAAIGKDNSGNGNNWTPNNISVTAGATYDSMLDVPTPWADGGNGRGNYPVINRLDADTSSLGTSITFGNLRASGTTYAASVYSCTFQVPQSGKWYYETVYSALTSAALVGIRSYSTGSTDVTYASNGNKVVAGSTTAYGSSWTTNDVIGVAVDRDAGTVTFYKNNVSQGAINIPTNSARFDMAFNSLAPYGNASFDVNFGQRPFAYTPPSGFLALNTQNLPTPTIAKGNQFFDATTYTGNGTTNRAVVNAAGFQPDLVWVKSRSSAASHLLVDAVRGASAVLYPNATTAEQNINPIASFNSNGFSVNEPNTGADSSNINNVTYVGWQWKEGATQGFDIVTYTGTGVARTVAHSLGVAPSMMILKRRSAIDSWPVYHASIGAANALILNNTNAQGASGAAYWNSTAPTSSVFSLGTDSAVNANTSTYVAYLFAEVAGFSRFGSYTGNGSVDGPYIDLGFRARFVMTKRSSGGTGDWYILDTARNTVNVMNARLVPNLADAEATGSNLIDITASGFKVRDAGTGINASGSTYIYAAFAENPFKYSLAR